MSIFSIFKRKKYESFEQTKDYRDYLKCKQRIEQARARKDTKKLMKYLQRRGFNDANLSQGAKRALQEIKDPNLIKPLIAVLLKSNDWSLVFDVVEILEKIDIRWFAQQTGTLAVSEFIKQLKHRDSNYRRKAAWVLKMIKDPCTVESLINALKDTDINVRDCAAEALGEIGDPRAIVPLMEAMKEGGFVGYDNTEHRVTLDQTAAEALGKIAGRRFGNYPQIYEWFEQNKVAFLKCK